MSKIVLPFVELAACFLIAILVGGFSPRQALSIALIVTASLTYLLHIQVAPLMAGRFRPIRVRIEPKWYEILRDFKLIPDHDSFCALIDGRSNSFFRSGFNFTVFEQMVYADFAPHWRRYLEFEEALDPLRIEHWDPHGRSLFKDMRDGWPVSLFMEMSSKGYDLGLEVPGEWWNLVRGSCPEPTGVGMIDPDSGYLKLILATIPHSEFLVCRLAEGWRYTKDGHQTETRIGADRSALGWQEEQLDPDLRLPIRYVSITHEYFSVRHQDTSKKYLPFSSAMLRKY